MLEFRSGADIIVTGVTFQNAPYWALHLYNCTRFSVVGVRRPVAARRRLTVEFCCSAIKSCLTSAVLAPIYCREVT